jgi:hypothetical protein
VVCPLGAAKEFCTIADMPTAHPRPAIVPQRTPQGRGELERRELGLSQRQRTMLFLVDGRRDLVEIERLAAQAGADRRCLDELIAMGLVGGAGASPDNVDTSILPSSLSLQGDSHWSPLDDDWVRLDRPLDEARSLLLRAVRAAAPVAGTLTIMKLRRATTREALEALLDEVESRLRKPHRQIIAAQTMRHVRHLLSLPSVTRPPR